MLFFMDFRSNRVLKRAVIGLGLLCACAVFEPRAAFAQAGDLAVAPTRVVFDGRVRSAQLSLVNKGAETATYRVIVVNMKMDENGQMQRVDGPDGGKGSAAKLFRYSPRQVTLRPGETQAVRLLLRKPGDLAAGEYRSHLLMQNVPKDAGISVEQEKTTEGVQIRMVPVFGITIPVIVRHGATSADVSLDSLKIEPAGGDNKVPRLHFTINRKGTRSAFGDLTATLDAGGKKTVIGQVMRLAVYTPNATRKVSMALRLPNGTDLSAGKIVLSFNHTEDDGGKVMAAAELALN